MRTNKKAARHKVRGKKKAARKTKVFSLGMSLGSRDQEASEPTLPETPEPTTQPSEVDTDVEAFKNLATRSQPGVLLVDFPPPTAKEIDQQNRRVIAEYHKQLAAGELFDGTTKRKADEPVLTTDKDWRDAPIEPPVLFLGKLWHSKTKGMFTMKTDKGKTQWAVALGRAIAYGKPFCEWDSHKPATVLFIEGESPDHLVQRTVLLQSKALGLTGNEKPNFHLLAISNDPAFPFLNTDEGRKWLYAKIEQHKAQFVIFDNIAALAPNTISKSAGVWIFQMMRSLITPLNLKNVGQLWLHHPDKKGKKQHGTGARNWGLHLELFGEPVLERLIGFNLRFLKKKDDDGTTDDFKVKYIGLEDGKWITDEPRQPLPEEPDHQEEPRATELTLAALRAVAGEGWTPGEMDSIWADKSIEFGICSSANPASRKRAFRRQRDKLRDTGQVECCRVPGEHHGQYRVAGVAGEGNVIAFPNKPNDDRNSPA